MIDRFLVLGLRLGKHIDGFVDSYYGPAELKEQVDAEEPTDPGELAAEAGALLGLAADLEGQRGVWLRAQLVGLETVARRLRGDVLPWSEEVERCYGVTPTFTPEDEFERAHALLDETFGDEAGYRRWLDSQVVPRDRLLPASELLRDDVRERTRAQFELPDGEEADVEIVTNEPWAGFNYYLGGLRSHVVVNADLPTWSYKLAKLVTHELYPGHHTEHAWKEELLVRTRGILEESIMLTGTPQSLVSEGIAMVSGEILFDGDLHPRAAALLEPLGVPYDFVTAAQVERVDEVLAKVRDNMAFLLNEESRPLDEVIEYGIRWRRLPRERIEKMAAFVTDPTWRAYVACYTNGHELVRRFAGGDRGRFRRLLTEQFTTADLVS